jgi:hypothetical protein
VFDEDEEEEEQPPLPPLRPVIIKRVFDEDEEEEEQPPLPPLRPVIIKQVPEEDEEEEEEQRPPPFPIKREPEDYDEYTFVPPELPKRPVRDTDDLQILAEENLYDFEDNPEDTPAEKRRKEYVRTLHRESWAKQLAKQARNRDDVFQSARHWETGGLSTEISAGFADALSQYSYEQTRNNPNKPRVMVLAPSTNYITSNTWKDEIDILVFAMTVNLFSDLHIDEAVAEVNSKRASEDEFIHAFTIAFFINKRRVVVYDTAGWINTEDLFLRSIYNKDCVCPEMRETLRTCFGEGKDWKIFIPFMPYQGWPEDHPDSCAVFSAWIQLWITLNPSIASTHIPPRLIRHDSIGFERFVRSTARSGELILPQDPETNGIESAWKPYVGGKKISPVNNVWYI